MLNHTNQTCPINWQDLYTRIPDEGIIEEFSGSFVKNGQKLMQSLQQAVASGDPEQIELYAHAMKGSASNIGAIPLAKIAWQLENRASEKDIETAGQWLEAIKTEFELVNSFLQQANWIAQAKEGQLK